MPRLNPVTSPSAEQQQIFDNVKAGLGLVPNMVSTMAQSPHVAKAYLGFAGTLGGGSLSAALGEQIALAVAGVNGCTYCASAHTVLGSQAGVSAGEAEINIEGRSEDPKTQAALQFARAVAISRGHIEDAAFDAVRAAGFTDGEIAEIVGHVALNTFTNIFNSVADTEVDFPRVEIPAGVSA